MQASNVGEEPSGELQKVKQNVSLNNFLKILNSSKVNLQCYIGFSCII